MGSSAPISASTFALIAPGRPGPPCRGQVEADRRLQIEPGAGHVQRHRAAEAIADGGDAGGVGLGCASKMSSPACPSATMRSGAADNSPMRAIICARSGRPLAAAVIVEREGDKPGSASRAATARRDRRGRAFMGDEDRRALADALADAGACRSSAARRRRRGWVGRLHGRLPFFCRATIGRRGGAQARRAIRLYSMRVRRGSSARNMAAMIAPVSGRSTSIPSQPLSSAAQPPISQPVRQALLSFPTVEFTLVSTAVWRHVLAT